MIFYSDDQIQVRDIEEADAISLFSCRIDEEINQYDPRPTPKSSRELLKECEDFCKTFDTEIMNMNIEDRKYHYFVITNLKGDFIGFVNLFSINYAKKEGELGVTIGDKRYWEKGIAYTATKVVMEYIYNNFEIDRIYIETAETNEPAQKLSTKLNFKKCSEYTEAGNFKFIVMEHRKEADKTRLISSSATYL